MRIIYNKKLARSLQSMEACKKKYGKDIAILIHKLIQKLKQVTNFQQLRRLKGHFHRLGHLPIKNIYAVTLRQPYRCLLHIDIASCTVTIDQIVDYHGKIEKLYKL